MNHMMKKALLAFLFVAVPLSAQALKPFERDGKYGYRDSRGAEKIAPRFQYAGDFNAHGFASVIENNKAWLIDAKGKPVAELFIFDNGPDYFEEGFARFLEKGKMGFIDERGRKVIPAVYDFVFPFEKGVAAACNGCKSRPVGEHSVIEGGEWFTLDKKGRRVDRPSRK